MPSDAEINALNVRIQEATRDIETGERLYDGVFAHVTVEDAEQAATFLAALRDERDQYKTAFADGYDAAKDEYRDRVRELEQKLERARVALEEMLFDYGDKYDGECRLKNFNELEMIDRARATLAEIGQRE